MFYCNRENGIQVINMVEGRCMKCRIQVEMQNPQETMTKNGLKMAKGTCPNCGTTVCRMLGR